MMRVVSACVVALVAGALAAEIELDEGVLVGTADNFEGIIADNEFVLAEFYAPWCGHCKTLAPEYAKAATQLAEAGSPIKLVKVDATAHEDLGTKYDVSGFPTLKWFKNGADTEFSGGRTADDIVAWVTKKSGPPAVPCESVADCNKLKDESAVVAFGFFESADSDEAKAFAAAADKSDLPFVITTSAEVATALAEVTAPKIVVFTDFDEKRFDFEGAYDGDEISTFVTGSSLPLVVEFTEQAAPKIFGGDVKSHFIIFSKFTDESWEKYSAAFVTAAKPFKGKVLFITMDTNKEENERIMEFFGITAEDVPTYRIINVEAEMAKYAPDTVDITAEGLTKFAQDYVDGNLGKSLNSEETPEDWDAQPVKVLTGGNFAQVALDESKNVFVEFYAPWCGHCKQLAPIFDKLGEAFESVENVVIAKMDSTANEIDGVQVESFPTIKLFKAGSADVAAAAEFEGDRTLSGMTEYLNEQTGSKVEVPADAEGEDEDDGEEPHGAGTGDENHDEL